MSATPEVPPVETIPLGLGFDAYGITRGDILRGHQSFRQWLFSGTRQH